MSKNNFLRTYVLYLFLFNIALIFAYSFSYFESQIFIDNFQDLNLSRLEIFLIINLLTSFIDQYSFLNVFKCPISNPIRFDI